jgi:hypothetical protein
MTTRSSKYVGVFAALVLILVNPDTDYQNGIDSHLDVGVSRFLNQQLSAGLVGFAYVQLTPDDGQPAALGSFRGRTSESAPRSATPSI